MVMVNKVMLTNYITKKGGGGGVHLQNREPSE